VLPLPPSSEPAAAAPLLRRGGQAQPVPLAPWGPRHLPWGQGDTPGFAEGSDIRAAPRRSAGTPPLHPGCHPRGRQWGGHRAVPGRWASQIHRGGIRRVQELGRGIKSHRDPAMSHIRPRGRLSREPSSPTRWVPDVVTPGSLVPRCRQTPRRPSLRAWLPGCRFPAGKRALRLLPAPDSLLPGRVRAAEAERGAGRSRGAHPALRAQQPEVRRGSRLLQAFGDRAGGGERGDEAPAAGPSLLPFLVEKDAEVQNRNKIHPRKAPERRAATPTPVMCGRGSGGGPAAQIWG